MCSGSNCTATMHHTACTIHGKTFHWLLFPEKKIALHGHLLLLSCLDGVLEMQCSVYEMNAHNSSKFEISRDQLSLFSVPGLNASINWKLCSWSVFEKKLQPCFGTAFGTAQCFFPQIFDDVHMLKSRPPPLHTAATSHKRTLSWWCPILCHPCWCIEQHWYGETVT